MIYCIYTALLAGLALECGMRRCFSLVVGFVVVWSLGVTFA